MIRKRRPEWPRLFRRAAIVAVLAALGACSSPGEAVLVTPSGDIIRVQGDGALPAEIVRVWQEREIQDPAPESPSVPRPPARESFAFDIPPADQCWAGERQNIQWLSEDTIFYCGVISRAGFERFVSLVRRDAGERPHRLVIASAGGQKDWPLEMAEFVRAEGFAEILVAGPCFSGCAHFVFPAIAARSLTPSGQLGLHNTSSSIVRILERQGSEQFEKPENMPLRMRADFERDFLKQAGVRQLDSFLTDPQAMLGTKCMMPLRIDATGEQIYGYESAYVLWLPDDAQWRAWGLPFERLGNRPDLPPASLISGGIAMNREPLSRETVRSFWRRTLPQCDPPADPAVPEGNSADL